MDRKAFQVLELFKTMLEETEEVPNFVSTGGKQTNTLKLYNEQSKGISTDLCEQTRTIVRSKLHDPIHTPPFFFFFFWNFKKNFGHILKHMGSVSPTRDRIHTHYIRRWSLNHWGTRKVPIPYFFHEVLLYVDYRKEVLPGKWI